MKTTIIILAAGESSRLGQPKQLLVLNGQTLLGYTISEAKASDASHIIVVLGAFSKEIIQRVDLSNVIVVINEDWQKGMSSSLQKGLAYIPNNHNALFLLCDQPFINSSLINQFIHQRNTTSEPIIAAKYDHTLGVPALFKPSVFKELQQLTVKQGARKIIRQYAQQNNVFPISFDNGKFDLDTMTDYKMIKNKFDLND